MWRIFKTELDYNKKLFLVVLALIPLTCLYEMAISEERLGFILIAIYFATVFWNIFRNKEKRDFQIALLPLSARHIALARLLTIAVASSSLSALYLLIHFQNPPQSIKFLAHWATILCGFSIYFALRDLYKNSFIKFGITKARIKIIAILFALGLNIMIFYAIFKTKSTGEVHYFIRYLNKFNLLVDPPANDVQIVFFFIFSLVLAYSTLFTYTWRRSYLE